MRLSTDKVTFGIFMMQVANLLFATLEAATKWLLRF